MPFRLQAWCERKRYQDGDKVTRSKVTAYVSELLAPKVVIDKVHPHLSIHPIRINATEDFEGELLSMETVQGYIKAVGDLYTQQCMRAEVPTEKDCIRSPEVNALLEDFKKL